MFISMYQHDFIQIKKEHTKCNQKRRSTMYLEQLHYLETLSKYPSINQASEALFISQPSLSRAITKLENELNLQLVQRTNKKCVLTEDGLEVLKHASKITEEIANIYKYASERNEQSEVRFVSIPGICDSLIIDAINLYQKTNQNTKHLSTVLHF